jgi:hypothetical protein
MVLVLEHLVELANERLASRNCQPIAYGALKAERELGVRHSAVTEALRSLERHGIIERVRRLPGTWFKNEGEGAWTWRLVVVPAIVDPSSLFAWSAEPSRSSQEEAEFAAKQARLEAYQRQLEVDAIRLRADNDAAVNAEMREGAEVAVI